MQNFDRNDLLNLNEINRKQIIKKKIEPGALYDARNIKELPKFPQQPKIMPLIKTDKQYEPGILFDARNAGKLAPLPIDQKPNERIKKKRDNKQAPVNLPTYNEVIAKNIKERERIGKVAVLGDFNDQLPEPNINGSMFEDDVEVDIESDDDLPTKPLIAGMILAGMVNLGFGLYK